MRGPGIAHLAVATMAAIVGVRVGAAIFDPTWTVDANRNLAAGAALVAGRFGEDHTYLYTPLAAALTVPWTWLPAWAAMGGWLAVRLGVLAAGTARATRGWRTPDRWLALAAATLYVPTLYDLLLGNVTVLLAAAIALVAWPRDRWWWGIALGLALATTPKPQLIPVLVWMLVYRRHALAGTVVTAALATAGAELILGVDTYRAWIGVLRSIEYLTTPQFGNQALGAVIPALAVPLSLAAIAAAAIGILRGPWPGLICCLALGLLVSPYTLVYGAAVLLVAVRPLVDANPRAAFALAITAPLGAVVPLPLWLAAVMAVALATPVTAWRGGTLTTQ